MILNRPFSLWTTRVQYHDSVEPLCYIRSLRNVFLFELVLFPPIFVIEQMLHGLRHTFIMFIISTLPNLLCLEANGKLQVQNKIQANKQTGFQHNLWKNKQTQNRGENNFIYPRMKQVRISLYSKKCRKRRDLYRLHHLLSLERPQRQMFHSSKFKMP